MRGLLMVRDALGRFYGKYDTWIRLFFKFILAFTSFTAISSSLGQMALFNNPMLLFGLAVICAFLPSNSILLIGTALILGHFYGISLESAVVGGGMLVIGILLYFGIAPESALPLIMTALGMPFGLGCASAILFGLLAGPLSAVGTAFGVFAYYLIQIVADNGGMLEATAADAAEAMAQRMAELIDHVIASKEMLVTAAALAVVLLVVYVIRNLEMKYAWNVASVAGVLCYLGVQAAGAIMFGFEVDWIYLGLGTVSALVIAWIAQMMLFNLDYRRTEQVRFEDDDYFYYVKAVPKKKVLRRKRRRRAEGR